MTEPKTEINKLLQNNEFVSMIRHYLDKKNKTPENTQVVIPTTAEIPKKENEIELPKEKEEIPEVKDEIIINNELISNNEENSKNPEILLDIGKQEIKEGNNNEEKKIKKK